MEIVVTVDRRTALKLRALAAECGVELGELAAEGMRAFVGAAPRRDEPRVVWNGARAGVGGPYLTTEV